MSKEIVVTASQASSVTRSICAADRRETIDHRAMLNLNSFRLSGRSGGVDNVGEIVRRDLERWILAALRLDTRLHPDRGRLLAVENREWMIEDRDLPSSILYLRHLLLCHENRDLRVFHHESQPVFGICRVQRHICAASLQYPQ